MPRDTKSKTAVATIRPPSKTASEKPVAKSTEVTIRSVANKVSKMDLEGRLKIFIKAGLMTPEQVEAALAKDKRKGEAKKPKRARSKTTS